MLKVIFPKAFVARTITVRIYTEASCYVMDPVAFEDIAINMIKSATSMGLTILKVTFVSCPIRPDLNAIAMFQVSLPLSGIYCPIFEFERVMPIKDRRSAELFF
jgi:hypothetical protein